MNLENGLLRNFALGYPNRCGGWPVLKSPCSGNGSYPTSVGFTPDDLLYFN
jgi:hypothetical protein